VNICHLTSVHSRFDVRIFLKECCSLVNAGHHGTLIVADGKGDETKNGVTIIDVGAPHSRIDRMINVTRRIYRAAKTLNADIYHFHDPELIPTGLKLKRLGKKVILDAHEDVHLQILCKPYLNGPTRYVCAKAFSLYEKRACRHFDAIVAATPFIRDRFIKNNQRTVNVNNYPRFNEFHESSDVSYIKKENKICYIGGITEIRGIKELISSMSAVECELDLAGTIQPESLRKKLLEIPGWEKIHELGFVNRQDVKKVLETSKAGIVTFHPKPNHINAQPNKLFEYLSASIPVIASDFPLWREIIDKHTCGILVDPLNPREISEAINWIISHPEKAAQMGKNGREAVEKRFNWENERRKLLNLYEDFFR